MEGISGLKGLIGGLGAGGFDGIASSLVFYPCRTEPAYLGATSGPVRDGTFDVSDGNKVSYRFHVPAEKAKVKVVVLYFHGNAQVCTAMDDIAEMLRCHGAALLSISFRGFSWGTGQPSLTKLCSDADQCFLASDRLLEAAGFGAAKRVTFGHSMGATCAVHLAARHASKIHGLIIDSGLMSMKQLPSVAMFTPINPQLFQMLPEPFDTLDKLAAVGCPALVMHGDQDEIVPCAQALQCYEKLGTPQKKLRRWEGAMHSNVRAMFGELWRREIKLLIDQAMDFTITFPAGVLVEAHSLSNPIFNGMQGRILGPQGERLRVSFPEPHGEKALKPGNVKIIEEELEKPVCDFPTGAQVATHSLSAPAFNGLRGTVLGAQNGRVRVEFPKYGVKALKPVNLKLEMGENG